MIGNLVWKHQKMIKFSKISSDSIGYKVGSHHDLDYITLKYYYPKDDKGYFHKIEGIPSLLKSFTFKYDLNVFAFTQIFADCLDEFITELEDLFEDYEKVKDAEV